MPPRKANGELEAPNLKRKRLDDSDLFTVPRLDSLLNVKDWSTLIERFEQFVSDKDKIAHVDKQAFCRAVAHAEDVKDETVELARSVVDELLEVNAEDVDALLARSVLATRDGDLKLASDSALAALQASKYQDKDAIDLLQKTQIAQHQAVSKSVDIDHYATLHVARTAPLAVIVAAHGALDYPEGSAERLVADQALAALSDATTKAAYDGWLSKRITGGGGREVTGGSDLFASIIAASGITLPSGFVFPPSGRFQGGCGGGFEFTWGDGQQAAPTVE